MRFILRLLERWAMKDNYIKLGRKSEKTLPVITPLLNEFEHQQYNDQHNANQGTEE